LVKNCIRENEDRVKEVLEKICGLSRLAAIRVRALCLKSQKLASLILSTTCHQISDIVEFMSNLLNTNNDFVWQYMKQHSEEQLITDMKEKLLSLLSSKKVII
jgi:16S rRNA G527 N7-methylase RsmG